MQTLIPIVAKPQLGRHTGMKCNHVFPKLTFPKLKLMYTGEVHPKFSQVNEGSEELCQQGR
jgi:hypothetical protein